MSSPDPLRLRVAIRRHDLPEVKLVWPAQRSHDLTVSRLLAHINQVIPLEGGEWGLEDYAVELADGKGGSYECLHFQQVSHILKDDDQVLIRCLMGEDLRRRRLSGRHQISADGKHLIDGLVFGRPWTTPPRNRPTIELPPRKQARGALDYDGEDGPDGEGEAREPQLFLEGPEVVDDSDESFHDPDGDETDEEMEDDAIGEDEEALDEELRLLRQDNAAVVHDDASAEDPGPAPGTTNLDLGLLDGIVALRAAFPLTPATSIEAELLRQNRNLGKAYRALRRSNKAVLSFDEMMDKSVTGLLDVAGASPAGNVGVGLLPQRHRLDEVVGSGLLPHKKPLIEVIESSDDTSPGDSDDETSDSDDTSSSGTSGISRSGDTSDSSDNDARDSIHGGARDERSSEYYSSDLESSEDGSDASAGSRDAANDEVYGKGGHGNAGRPGRGDAGQMVGLTKTQKRNARRRKLIALRRLECLDGAVTEPQTASAQGELQERKNRLLHAIAHDSYTQDVDDGHQDSQADQGGTEQTRQGSGDPKTAAGKRRSRLDMGAGRRLVFGALGLKTPKTLADEENIRQELIKDARPLSNVRLAERGPTVMDTEAAAAAAADTEEWRQVVTYRAVECCQEGVVLSEPPFPFEQRWDPQQRGRARRKRKRASQDCYDDEDSGLYVDEEEGSAKRPRRGGSDPFRQMAKSDGSECDGGAKDKVPAADHDPELPADVSSLPELEAGTAVTEGTVITWKQMTMSEATRWQPQILQRSGTVLAGSDQEGLHVRLAVRDREDRQRVYDDKTGERIYGKFELPDSDGDDDDVEDDGERTLSWAEVMEPRVVQAAQAPIGDAAPKTEAQSQTSEGHEATS